MENYQVKSESGIEIDVNFYKTDNPKALVQILHGMQEYKGRYNDFAEYLQRNGYSVIIHDHAGHGKSINSTHPLGDMVSLDNTIKDIHLVRNSVLHDGEYICLGHSMGSFLARIYSSLYYVDKLILSGTGQNPGVLIRILQFMLLFTKSGVPLPFIQRLMMDSMGKGFDHPMDWLSLNIENRDKYINDGLCGCPFTKEGYRTLLHTLLYINKSSTYRDCTAEKILLIAGERDPVGHFTRDVIRAKQGYECYGKYVKMILYKNMSHEVLNETDKETVYNDIISFCSE